MMDSPTPSMLQAWPDAPFRVSCLTDGEWRRDLGQMLCVCAGCGELDRCRILIDMGANPCGEERFWGPLLSAAHHGNLEVCQLLVQAGANPLLRDGKGHNALHWACVDDGRGHPGIVSGLMDLGCDLEAADDEGRTPLHRATLQYEGLDMVKGLLVCGANPNAVDNNVCSPLHTAVTGHDEGAPEICRALLAHGCDASLKNVGGKTASTLARMKKLKHLAAEIQSIWASQRALRAMDLVTAGAIDPCPRSSHRAQTSFRSAP